ncbi:MAG: esterase-like activity of phytase family protein [Pseudomonadota bacterium]
MNVFTIAAMLAAGTPIDVNIAPFADLDDVGCLTVTSGHTLTGPNSFGGYSGVELDAETGALTILADNGHIVTATATLDANGAVTGLEDSVSHTILDQNGEPLTKRNGDTEALTRRGDGFLITREGQNDAIHVVKGDQGFQITEQIADLSALESLKGNGGFEAAVALGPESALLITESLNDDGHAVVQHLMGSTATTIADYQPKDNFSVTDIAADQKTNRLFILERAFSPTLGPRARLTVLPTSRVMDAEGETLVPAVLGRMTFFDGADNMEGIAFYRSEDGGENLLLVSDDNFNPAQRTVLITLRIKSNCPLAPAKPGPGADETPEESIDEDENR